MASCKMKGGNSRLMHNQLKRERSAGKQYYGKPRRIARKMERNRA